MKTKKTILRYQVCTDTDRLVYCRLTEELGGERAFDDFWTLYWDHGLNSGSSTFDAIVVQLQEIVQTQMEAGYAQL